MPGGFDNTHGEFATVAIDLPSDLRDLVNNAPATLDGTLPPDAERKILLGDLRRAVVE